MRILSTAMAAALLLFSRAPLAQGDPGIDVNHVDAYITPFYNSAGPQINIGPFSEGLASTNDAQFVATIREMKRRFSEFTFVQIYVAAIRLYDLGYRKEAVYWFYSAQYRARFFSGILDQRKKGGIGDAGFELLHAGEAFHALAGPYINGYAFGDMHYLDRVIQRVRKENQQTPDVNTLTNFVAFKERSAWTLTNDEVNDGLEKFRQMLKEKGDEIKKDRIAHGTDAAFGKLKNRDFPGWSDSTEEAVGARLKSLRTHDRAHDGVAADADRQSLIRLGCFDHVLFQLKSRSVTTNNWKEFSKMAANTSFINDSFALVLKESKPRTIEVTAHRGDMPQWQKLVTAFDDAKTP